MFQLPQVVTKSVPWDESKHPRDAGKFSSSPGASGKQELQPHNERLAALRAQIDAAKRARREAHEELREHADRHSEEANEHVRSIREDHVFNLVSWVPEGVEDEEPYQEFNDAFTELDLLSADYDHEGTASERFESIRDHHTAAKNALEKLEALTPSGDGEDDWKQEHIDENREHLNAIVEKTRLAARALKEHANRKREMRDVREIKAVQFELPGMLTKARGLRGLAARVITSAIRGHFDESKHRRGQPGNRGQFASGGGGSSKPTASKRPGGPPPLPKRGGSGAPAGRASHPGFGTKIQHPPSLPGKNTPSMPGTGHPPENIGNPKDENEAREHFIWLMGRAGILRRQGQGGQPLSPKQQKELTLSINLANRIHAQHFSDEALAKKESKEAGKETDPFGMETVAERLKPIADLRPNAALDEFMSEKPSEKPKPRSGKTELRPNSVLDDFFGKAFTLTATVKKISPKSA